MSIQGQPPTQRPPTQGPQIAQQRVEVQRMRQEEIRLEQERRRVEEEERKRRVESTPVRLPSGIAARPEKTSDFEQIYDDYIGKGFDPKDAFSFASARASQKELAKEGKTFTGQTLYITDTEARGITDYTESQAQGGISEAEARKQVGEIIGGRETPFGKIGGIRGPSSYAISKDRFGNVTDIAVYSERPDIKSTYASFKEQYKFAPAPERVPLRYEVGIGEGKSSTLSVFEKDTGKRVPLKYEVFLEDRLSGGPYHYFRDIGKADKEVFSGTTPFIESPERDDPVAGFTNVFKNIGEFAASGAGRFREARYEPEVEASIFSAIFGAGKRFVERKPAELQLTLVSKEFGEIGQSIQKRPFYSAGSIAASAALWLFPYGKVASAARATIPGLKAASKAPRARVDYNPLLGSFADRPSVRFGPYNPTRWENPEALAELAKFRSTVDFPKAAKITVPAAKFTTEFARPRQDSSIVETRGGSLLIERAPTERTRVESIGQQAVKQTVQRAVSENAGRGSQASYDRMLSGVSLGFRGATGAGRRRRSVASELEQEILRFPQATRSETFQRLSKRNALREGDILTSRQDASINTMLRGLTGTRSIITRQRSSLAEITGLRSSELQGLRLSQASATRSLESQLSRQLQRSLLKEATAFRTPRTFRMTGLIFPGATERKKDRKGKRKSTGFTLRDFTASSVVGGILGKESDIAKGFERLAKRAKY